MSVPSYLIDTPDDINKKWLETSYNIGITAGASAPEVLVDNVIEYLKNIFPHSIVNTLHGIHENVKFKLPKEVR